jgi:hypothetical protein
MAAILVAMSELQEEMKEMKKERFPRKQSPEPKKNQTNTPKQEREISRNSGQYLAQGLESESGEEEQSGSGEESETSEDEEEAKPKSKKKTNRKSAEKSRERHRAKEQADWLRWESHVPATPISLAETSRKEIKFPKFPTSLGRIPTTNRKRKTVEKKKGSKFQTSESSSEV